ncbi:hypothetical protein FCG67_10135 [Rhodococcus oryzae]|uniref:Ricin B lectin domain-containing protein n=1 Tax=Rhodococcus oryzae TaxID=2571143 RepID=A0ABY2RNG5_9NOCA|nr:hypothetical protein [Rhodococcus oryzae]TJZ78399.1 hypothetical protein FCG67_10135 [Rhodococcus oryzae]
MRKKQTRRTATILGLLAAPIVLGATIGTATAGAQPWEFGPLYRSEFSGDSGQHMCSKAALIEQTSRAIVIVPCTQDPATGNWYRIVFNPLGHGS